MRFGVQSDKMGYNSLVYTSAVSDLRQWF